MKWAKIEDSNASKRKVKWVKIKPEVGQKQRRCCKGVQIKAEMCQKQRRCGSREETLAACAGNHHLLFLLIQPCSHRNVSNVSDTSLKQCSAGLPMKTFPVPFLGLLGPQPELHPTHFIHEMLLLYS
jgi:hypothetical protein